MPPSPCSKLMQTAKVFHSAWRYTSVYTTDHLYRLKSNPCHRNNRKGPSWWLQFCLDPDDRRHTASLICPFRCCLIWNPLSTTLRPLCLRSDGHEMRRHFGATHRPCILLQSRIFAPQFQRPLLGHYRFFAKAFSYWPIFSLQWVFSFLLCVQAFLFKLWLHFGFRCLWEIVCAKIDQDPGRLENSRLTPYFESGNAIAFSKLTY